MWDPQNIQKLDLKKIDPFQLSLLKGILEYLHKSQPLQPIIYILLRAVERVTLLTFLFSMHPLLTNTRFRFLYFRINKC